MNLMLYTIQNEFLTVKIESVGAELHSIRHQNGCEYLWQGDPAYWGEHAPWLFPICSHLWEDRYLYRGRSYTLCSRNFTHKTDFSVLSHTASAITLALFADKQTKVSYPFDFTFTVSYRLEGEALHTSVTVQNNGTEVMPFSFGAHPGFNIPLESGSDFGDWYLDFGEESALDEILLSPNVYLDGRRIALPLTDGKLRLAHGLFTLDGRFFARVPNKVTLKSERSPRFITIDFPEAPYLGLWSKPYSDAPLLCIEPWHGLPSYDGIVDDMDTKNDMYRLLPAHKKIFQLTYTFG